jgi:hypothetical protein
MKAQSALEYIVIVGISLGLITLFGAYAWQENEINTRARQAEIAVAQIASTADNLYAQGPGARSTINVYFPVGYQGDQSSVTKQNKTIIVVYTMPTGFGNAIAATKANVTGYLPNSSGYKQLKMEVIGGNVNITSS